VNGWVGRGMGRVGVVLRRNPLDPVSPVDSLVPSSSSFCERGASVPLFLSCILSLVLSELLFVAR
jgi:hypothetical protein